MCGISCIVIRGSNSVLEEELNLMNDKIQHRGPDDEGVFLYDNVGLGHRRLSIIDLSKDGHQPMHYLDRYVITYNGEIFNYIELKKELTTFGYKFRSSSDTEVLLAAYDCWGDDCLDKFNGMWAFVILDKKKNEIFCSRDRYGIKPLYYTDIKSKFLIGSEIKQFTNIEGFEREVDHTTAFNFLRRGILNQGDLTFFKHVKMLKPGHILKYNLLTHEVKIQRWYDVSSIEIRNDLSFEDAKEYFYKLFQDSVALRMRSDVTVGSCLSGGMDSSSIVCMSKELLGKSGGMETISSCFNDKRYDEQEYIDEVLNQTKFVGHKVFPSLDDLFEHDMLDKLVYHQDQPVISASHYAEYKVFNEAKKNNLTVMLDGQGADEILAGYMRYFPAHYTDVLSKFRLVTLLREMNYRKELHKISRIKSMSELSRFILHPKIQNLIIQKALRIKTIPSWYNIEVAKNLNLDEILGDNHRTTAPIFRKKIKEININSLSKIDINLASIPYQCHSEDKNSMANSIESRIPFLDYRLVEFSLSLPGKFKIRNGQTKSVLRESLRPILPAKVVNRHRKMGFVTPQEVWMKKYANTVKEELGNVESLTGGLIKSNIVKGFEQEVRSKDKINPAYFRILSFSRWAKVFGVSF